MDIENIAWGVAVDRTPRPPRCGDSATRKAQLEIYVEQLYAQHENIMRNFNDVLNGLGDFVLVPKESLKAAISWMDEDIDCHHVSGDMFMDLYEHKPILEKAMIEARGEK